MAPVHREYRIILNCKYFEGVARSLAATLTAGGHACTVARTPAAGCLHVVFTAHHLHEPLPAEYVAYNLEQLTTSKAWPPAFFERLRRAREVWDYSLENIAELRRSGQLPADRRIEHVPVTYHPSADALPVAAWPPASARPLRWAMVGAPSPRREAWLRGLDRAEGLVTNDAWGAGLVDRVYRRALVCVNVHFYDGHSILEATRLVPMIANGMLVVSERSADAWYDERFEGLVTFVDDPDGLARAVGEAARLSDEEHADLTRSRRHALLARLGAGDEYV